MENFQDTFEIGKLSFINGFFNLHEYTFNTLIGRLVPAAHAQHVNVTILKDWQLKFSNLVKPHQKI